MGHVHSHHCHEEGQEKHGHHGERFIDIVDDQNGRVQYFVPTDYPAQVLEEVKGIFSPDDPGYILVICSTKQEDLLLASTFFVYPFVAIICALNYIGHRVVVYSGATEHLQEVAKGADVVLIDGGVSASLVPNFKSLVDAVAPSTQYFIQDRDGTTLREWE